MFGTYRLLLASLVMLKHFKDTEVFSGMAVWAFFLLSGFLITGILNTRYGFGRSGLVEFAINRLLRLLPTYWVSVALALLLIIWVGPLVDARLINDALAVPRTAWEWVPTVAILGGTFFGLGRLPNAPSPSAWAVEVEILMYFCSVLWVSRSPTAARRTTLACLALFPLLWLVAKWLVRAGQPELAGSMTYSFLPAALLPYAIGAWLWHARERFVRPANPPLHLAAAALGIAMCGFFVARISVTLAFLLTLPLFAYVTVVLANFRGAPGARKRDDFFGHMSYPVYLMHWIGNYSVVAAATAAGLGAYFVVPSSGGLLQSTLTGFVALTVTTMALAALVAALVEAPIEIHRRGLAARWRDALLSTTRRREA